MNVKKFTDNERAILQVGEVVEAHRNFKWQMMRVLDVIEVDVNGYERCAVVNVDPASSHYGRPGCIFPGEIRECVR